MKKIVFPFMSIIMLGLSGCFNGGDNISTFPVAPAIVDFYSAILQPKIITYYGTFFAPELQKAMFTDLDDGDAIYTYFSVNYDQQPSSAEHYTVSEMQWIKVGRAYPAATPGGESTDDDFDVSIKDMKCAWMYDNIVFFEFEHTAPIDQKFTYEMTYDSDDPSVVYFRAKKNGTGTQTTSTLIYPYTFDMRFFPKDADNKLNFYIKYQVVDEEGNVEYKDWSDKPFEVTVE